MKSTLLIKHYFPSINPVTIQCYKLGFMIIFFKKCIRGLNGPRLGPKPVPQAGLGQIFIHKTHAGTGAHSFWAGPASSFFASPGWLGTKQKIICLKINLITGHKNKILNSGFPVKVLLVNYFFLDNF